MATMNIELIETIVCEFHGVDKSKIRIGKKSEIVTARMCAMYFAKKYTSLTLKAIAYHFNRTDHTTTIHAIKTTENYYEQNKWHQAIINGIEGEILRMINIEKSNKEIDEELTTYLNLL